MIPLTLETLPTYLASVGLVLTTIVLAHYYHSDDDAADSGEEEAIS